MLKKKLYLYLSILIFSWTLNPFLKKKLIKKINGNDFFILNHILVSVFIFGYYFYLKNKKECDLNCIKKLNWSDIGILTLAAVTSMAGAIFLPHLITMKGDVSYLISNIQPAVIALTFLVGYMFFKEEITINKIIGVILILIGIVMMNYKK